MQFNLRVTPETQSAFIAVCKQHQTLTQGQVLQMIIDRFNEPLKDNTAADAELAATKSELQTLQARHTELEQAANLNDERLTAANNELSKLTAELERLKEENQTLMHSNNQMQEQNEELSRVLSEKTDELDSEVSSQLKDACAIFECEPEELVSNILQMQKALQESSGKTTLVQAPIPDNAVLLADLTPFEKYVLDSVTQFSGAINAKELLIDRFLMPYQWYGNCDFKIRRMKADRLRLAKNKLYKQEEEQQ